MNLMMRNIYIFFLLFFSAVPALSQKIISGRIIDKTNGEPLQYAVIAQGHSGIPVNSDKEGYFRISLSRKTDSLDISIIGYKAQSFAVSKIGYPWVVQLERGPVDLESVTITPQSNNASFHMLSAIDLHIRPINSAQDLMRLVPGLFLGQHHGGGVAEHIFLRGFDADHGTDVNVSVDDMPVNLVSHAHGQGFSDLHFLIPELVTSYEFGKGPYYADHGDFTTAGYVAFHTADVLDKSTLKLEAGQFKTGRAMAMIDLLSEKAKQRGESAYIAGEAAYTNGPFDWPQHFSRLNLFGKYNVNINPKERLTFTFSTFSSQWRSSGEIPERAVDEGLTGRFGYLDSLQGGKTSRTNIIGRLSSSLSESWNMQNQFYYSWYDFSHRYNDTFFADDSVNGDRLRQAESRNLFGYNGKITNQAYFKNNIDLTSSFGLGFQFNKIHNSELSHIDDQFNVLENLQLGNINENIFNGYVDENLRMGKWLFNAGLRMDYLYFNYEDRLNPTLPSRSKVIFSPKLNVEYTANREIQLYVKTGRGFHSNDAKVVVANQGQEILPAAYGIDFGLNWKPADRLFINAAVWYLHLQQEFIYDGDEGTLEPSDKTRREGIDFSARYQFNSWLYAFLDINYSNARDIQAPKGSDYIPLAVPLSSAGGLNYKFADGINGGLSYRYMKDRPANEDNSLTAKGYFVTDLTTFYTKKKFEVGIEIQNLFNTLWREEQFEVESRLRNEPAPVNDINFTAGTPFFAKLVFAVFF
jgi:TonB-dependent Receptor Plug Domain/CarboxypepD_reg-like domain/Outer membrane protein beta-barrel family